MLFYVVVADMDAGNASRAEELAMVERRHKETVQSLKAIHMDEINAIKQRSKVYNYLVVF